MTLPGGRRSPAEWRPWRRGRRMAVGPLLVALGLVAGLAGAVPLALHLARRAERRARTSERRARDAEHLAYVGTLTGGLAHEIRNPLSTVQLNLQLLAEDLQRPGREVDPRVRRKLDTLRQEAARLQEILDAFMKFAGRLELDRAPTSLTAVVEECLAFYQDRLQRAGIDVLTQFDEKLPEVPMDPCLMKQALSNLVLNAESAMPEGGQLMLGTGADRQGVWVQVTDTGTGIPAAALEKVWRPYFSTRDGGTGLGLPTVRRIVRAHHGTIDVQSEPGRGTRFTVHIPYATDEGQTP